ncbi:MAG TPA: hypothetical protein PL182_01775 [Pseudobdellovibrionaceae bacterium]|nr:hypothetical protein [Pseudobdellovibrionaceae bacterium]
MNLAPSLAAIASTTVTEGEALPQIDAKDVFTGTDTDRDGHLISYSRAYDRVIDAVVLTGLPCASLPGFSFDTDSGIANWTPAAGSFGLYEFQIIGTDSFGASDSKIFTVEVRAPGTPVYLNPAAPTLVFDNCPDFGTDGVSYSCTVTVTDPQTTSGVTVGLDGGIEPGICKGWLSVSGSGASFTVSGVPSELSSCDLRIQAVDADGNKSNTIRKTITFMAAGLDWTPLGSLEVNTDPDGQFSRVARLSSHELVMNMSLAGSGFVRKYNTTTQGWTTLYKTGRVSNSTGLANPVAVSPLGIIYQSLAYSYYTGMNVLSSRDGGGSWFNSLFYAHPERNSAYPNQTLTLPNDDVLVSYGVSRLGGVMEYGLKLSKDHGETWTDVNLPAAMTRMYVSAGPNSEIYMAGGYGTGSSSVARLYVSTDSGASFSLLDEYTLTYTSSSVDGISSQNVSVAPDGRIAWAFPYRAYDPAYRFGYMIRVSDPAGVVFSPSYEISSGSQFKGLRHDSLGRLWVLDSVLRRTSDYSAYSTFAFPSMYPGGGMSVIDDRVYLSGIEDPMPEGELGATRIPVIKHSSNGTTWDTIKDPSTTAPLYLNSPQDVTVGSDGSIYLVTSQSHSNASINGSQGISSALYKSTDHGVNWTPLYEFFRQGGGATSMFRSIAVHPVTGDLYIAGYWFDASWQAFLEVRRSVDGGVSWSPVYSAATSVAMVGTVRLGISSSGQFTLGYSTGLTSSHLLKSSNGGTTWTDAGDIVGYMGDLLTVGASTIHICTSSRLYSSSDGGTTWNEHTGVSGSCTGLTHVFEPGSDLAHDGWWDDVDLSCGGGQPDQPVCHVEWSDLHGGFIGHEGFAVSTRFVGRPGSSEGPV